MKNITYILAFSLTVLYHFAQAQGRDAVITRSNGEGISNLQEILPHTFGKSESLLGIPVNKAYALKSNTQERLHNLGAPVAHAKSSYFIDNKAAILCTSKKPDSTKSENQVIVNHTEEWVVSDNYGKDWYLKDDVLNYNPENIAVKHFPINGDEIILPVRTGEYYQGVIWYKSNPYDRDDTPIAVQKPSTIKRYAPYLIPIAVGAASLARQSSVTSTEGAVRKQNNLPVIGINVASVLVTAGIINHQKKKQRAAMQGKFITPPQQRLEEATELTIPTLVMEVYTKEGKLVNKITQNLIDRQGDWQATQVAQTIPDLPGGKGNMIVRIEGLSDTNTSVFSHHGFSVKQVFQRNSNGLSSSKKLSMARRQMGQDLHNGNTQRGNPLNVVTSQLNPSNTMKDLAENHTVAIDLPSVTNLANKFNIKNPLSGISLVDIPNSYTSKVETAVQGFQIGNIVESNIQGIQDLDMKLIDAIGDKALSFKAKATQTVQEEAQKTLHIKDMEVSMFDMKHNKNVENIVRKATQLKDVNFLDDATSRYLPVLKEWAKNKGYENLNIDGNEISLLMENRVPLNVNNMK